jgi:hypothetical protein
MCRAVKHSYRVVQLAYRWIAPAHVLTGKHKRHRDKNAENDV